MSVEHQQAHGRTFECAAADLDDIVDAALNPDAIAEADAALRGGSEVAEHGVYLDSTTTIDFNPQSKFCGACNGIAELFHSGSIEAPICLASERCVVTTAAISPETYLDTGLANDSKRVPCRAIGCGAIIGVTATGNSIQTAAVEGTCAVERHEAGTAGRSGWPQRVAEALAQAYTVPPEHSLQSDGYTPNGSKPLA